MRDGPLLRALKAAVRAAWALEYGVRRWASRARRRPRWELKGACRSCAKCCERPAIQVGWATWRLPGVRRLFLAWQARVNGFALVEADPESRTFLFRCGHFDWITRRCDSYGSRPFMCRDYPRLLLEQPWPELFEGCGYRPRDANAEALLAALAGAELDDEARRTLTRRLYLD